MLCRLGGAALFRSSRPSPNSGYPFWLLALTFRSSRPAFCGRLTSPVSLRKTRFIQPHVLFTGVYLLKRLFVGFGVSRRASPFGTAPVLSFFASSAPPPWRSAFSRFTPVVNLGLPVLVSGSNRAVKPTRLRRAAYFRSLACEKPALFSPMFYSPAFIFSSGYLLGFCRVPGFAFWRCASFKLFWHLAPALLALAASVFVAFLVWPLCG